jgi:hypothetical protein
MMADCRAGFGERVDGWVGLKPGLRNCLAQSTNESWFSHSFWIVLSSLLNQVLTALTPHQIYKILLNISVSVFWQGLSGFRFIASIGSLPLSCVVI